MAAGHLIFNATTAAQGAPTMTPASFAVPLTQDVDEWDENSDEVEESTHHGWVNHTVPIVPPPVPRSSARDICNLLNPVSGNASGSGGQ